MKEHCGRCRMSFRVEEPYHTKTTSQQTAITTCAEKGCGKRFWHALRDKGPVIVGIFPADAKGAEI